MTSKEDHVSPIFVLGCGRSGTTLVRLLLTAHPDIGIPPEGRFVLDLFGRYYRGGAVLSEPVERFCKAVVSSDRFDEWKLDHGRILERLRSVGKKTYANLVDAVYRVYLAHLESGKRRWGDKNIEYVMEIPKILRLFPDARIIHVIRDGRDVALSYRSVEFGPRDLFGSAVFWRRRTLRGRAAGRRAGSVRYLEVQYENLVSKPEDACRRMCAFLGEAFSSEMLEFHEYNRRKQLVPQHRLGWHGNTLKPITASRSGLWREQMPTRELMIFESVAGKALKEFGYETHDFRVPARLRLALLRNGVAWAGRGIGRRVRESLLGRMVTAGGTN